MQVWYYTNLNQLKRVNNVNNTSYVRQDAYKFKSTRKPCKIPKISGSHHQFKQFFVIKLLLSHVETWFITLCGDHVQALGHSDPHICVKQKNRHRVLYRKIMDFKPPFEY